MIMVLNARFYHFKHVRSGGIAARTLRYSVPLSVHPHVLLIQPTTRFGEMRPLGSTVFDPNPKRFFAAAKPLVDYSAISEIFNATFCNTTVTPSCLRQLYNVNNYKANPKNGGSILVSAGALFMTFRKSTWNLRVSGTICEVQRPGHVFTNLCSGPRPSQKQLHIRLDQRGTCYSE